eukprot:TRINITY_DN1919_c0_g2_i1.p1 TRINITY_DN1919_c0_g2~~TRINITY_DN1919_c0_g2_i1.p1  ORF type:complete len:240 (+),score=47.52 TRINITY_DN1919_c0_g2_i1:67-786(+)
MALRRQDKENNQMQIYGDHHDAELFRSSKDADYRDWKAVAPVRVRRHERLGSNVLIGGEGGDRAEIMRPKNIALPEVREMAAVEKRFGRRKQPLDGGRVALGWDPLGTGSRYKTSYDRQCEGKAAPVANERRTTAAGLHRSDPTNTPGTSILTWSHNPHIPGDNNPMRRPGQRAEELLREAQATIHTPTPPASFEEPPFQQVAAAPEPRRDSILNPAGEEPKFKSGKRRSVQNDRRNFG